VDRRPASEREQELTNKDKPTSSGWWAHMAPQTPGCLLGLAKLLRAASDAGPKTTAENLAESLSFDKNLVAKSR
jgi:hypothetical protein